jgi:hypothetical protein
MKALMRGGGGDGQGGLSDKLASGVYAPPALVPASPWLDSTLPGKPELTARLDDAAKMLRCTWKSANGDTVWLWVVRTKVGKAWTVEVKPAGQTEIMLPMDAESTPEIVAVSAVDRTGNESPHALWQRKEP